MTPPDVDPVVLFKHDDEWVTHSCSCGEPDTPHDTGGDELIPYRALPAAQYDALVRDLAEAVARANTATVAADLMRARAERAEEALEYVVSMWAKPHRGSCGTTLKDAEQCIAGLEMEIDAVVEHARAALSTQRGEG